MREQSMPGQSMPGQSLPGQRIGSTIAAIFGLIYVMLNTGPFPTAWMVTLRALAVVAFLAVLVGVLRPALRSRHGDGQPDELRRGAGQQQRVFTRGYWWVVVTEAVALLAGTRVLSGPLHLPRAGVAWVSIVVGAHFFALAVVFGQPFFHWLGGAVTVCGITGLVLAVTGAGSLPIALVAGVLPGSLLLTFGWWGANRSTMIESEPIGLGPSKADRPSRRSASPLTTVADRHRRD